MLIKCCLFILGLILYCLLIWPLLSTIGRFFFPKTRINLSELSSKETKELIYQILKWCICNIHLKKGRRSKPSMFISRRTKTIYLGSYQYFNNRITVYILRHNSIEELCNTIIHEYVHHLQIRTSKDDIRYNRLTRIKSYWENDYEVEARDIASKYSKKCLNDLKL
ncbi:MAG: hypothetical protein RLZZ466_662 [Bacteroidota bacterium]|jgi:hypothetical protein